MKLAVRFSTKPVNLLALLNGSKERFLARMEKVIFTVGEESVNTIRRDFRSGGTTGTRTAVRSGRLWNAYGHREQREGTKITAEIGAIRSSADGKVPLHARVHEGYNASGQRVDEFVILPKKGLHLVFPIREGGGLAKSGIVGWVRAKRVILKPRPSLPTIAKTAPKEIARRGIMAFREILVGREAA